MKILASKPLPEPSQNPSKIEVPKNIRFVVNFCSTFFFFLTFDFLKIRRAACSARRVKPHCIFMLALAYCFSLLRGGQDGSTGRPKSHQVGTSLAHFSLLHTFFELLAASWAFDGRFLLILVVFFARWVAPGQILERPATIFESPKPYFSMF